jgi:GNAT superfamily N-acetyltransferase
MSDTASSASSSPITVRRATAHDLDEVTAVYAEAVWDEAVATWMIPDEERRHALGRSSAFRQYLGAQLANGALIVAGGSELAGVSVWARVDGSDAADDDPDEVIATVREIYGPYADRFVEVMVSTASAHPSDRPYLYLQQMAVLPIHRGRGLGSAMLRHGLQMADNDGLATYLEASTTRNRALYARHGFVDYGPPIQLSHGGPRLQPMLRESA